MFGALKAFRREPLPPAAQQPGAEGWLQAEEAIMGTAIGVILWADDPEQGRVAIAEVMAEMHRIDRTMSPHRQDSELARINREAHERAVPLSPEMAALLGRAQAFARLSGGAFDITYAAVGQLFDYRAGTAPSPEALAQARQAVGHQHLLLDESARTVRFAKPGMRIDLGGFAKGHAVDNAAAILQRLGIAHAHVSAGGDSRVIGDRRGRPWHIGVRDPRRADAMVAVLPLQDVSISTSGDYERCFERNGERFHHLINPFTGRSPTDVRSVTILADDGLTTEALSKAVFVLGVTRGLALIDSMAGVDAIVVDAQGVMHTSSGLSAPAPHAPPSAQAQPHTQGHRRALA